VTLSDQYEGGLLWSNGYYLISHNPINLDGKLIAFLTTKQYFTPLDALLPTALKWRETVDLVIFGNAQKNLDCFPNRSN